MKRIDTYLEGLLLENKYSFYLSFFRAFICLLLLKRTILLWGLAPLIYAGQSYLVPTYKIINVFFVHLDVTFIRENIYIFMGVYVCSLLLYLLGIGKNVSALVVFLLSDIIQNLCPQILNGGDNFLRFLLLYMVFADSFDYFSLAKPKLPKGKTMGNFFSNLAGLSICIHLCLIYFISAVHKIHSDVWFSGVATYYTLSIDRFNGTAVNKLLAKQPLFVTLSTYSTWFIELLYPTLIWFKDLRSFLVIAAIFLHLSIAVFMMLYDFQLIFIMVQGFFLTNSFWTNKYHRFKKMTLNRITLS